MYGGKVTLYDVLEVSRDAKREEIVRAYRRLVDDLKKESTMPDPGREARLHEAYEVLTDAHRRSFYDASLRKPKFFAGTAKAAKNPKWIGGLGAGLVALVAALYFSLRGPSDPPPLPPQEILANVSRAVAQVQALDISGRATAVGVAFAIAPGTLVTTCPAVPAGAQLMVRLGARTAPAQIAVADGELGICKLSVPDAGSWPLDLQLVEPRAGDKVYVATASNAGDVGLVEGTVKGSVRGSKGSVIEISTPIAAAMSGAPLLDARGRVVGVASSTDAYGSDKRIALPVKWIEQARARSAR